MPLLLLVYSIPLIPTLANSAAAHYSFDSFCTFSVVLWAEDSGNY